VSAADDHVSGSEIAELREIGAELGFSPEEIEAIRRDSLPHLVADEGDDEAS
jgi:argonaute-like protein implicated in RNA metabolism and viral defense